MGFDVDDVDDDDIGSVDVGFNGFVGENVGAIPPSLLFIQLSLYPSSFRLDDGIIDVMDVLEIGGDDNDGVDDENDGFDPFPSIGDDITSSSSLYLLLLLNLIFFCVFGEKLDGGIVVGDDDDNDDGNVGDCCGCIQPPPYI